jgi:O-antigen/teichoic acid export membrane protein
MAPMLIRFCSQAVAIKDFVQLHRITSAGQLLLGLLGIIGMLLGFSFIPVFVEFYTIAEYLIVDTRWLLICMSISLFFNMLLIIPQGVVFSVSRYDLVNGLEIFSNLFRLGLVIAFFELVEPSLALLGIAVLSTMLLRFGGLFIIAIRNIGSAMFLSFSRIDLKTIKSMLSFSMQTFINTIASSFVERLPVLLIGRFYGAVAVTAFSPALFIATGLCGFVVEVAKPLTPLASRELLNSDNDRRGKWSITISQLLICFGLAILIPLVVYGYELIGVWLGSDLNQSWVIVAIYAFAMLISQVQSVNLNMALGSSTIKHFVYSKVFTAVVLFLSLMIGTLIFKWYLIGITICIAACLFIRNVVYLPWISSRLFSFNYLHYLHSVFIKPILLFCIIVAFGFILKLHLFLQNLYTMLVFIPVLLTLYSVFCWLIVLDNNLKSSLINMLPALRLLHSTNKGIN